MSPEEYEIHLRNQVLEAQRALSLLAQLRTMSEAVASLKARIDEIEASSGEWPDVERNESD